MLLPMFMIAILHKVLLMVILQMLLPLIRPIKIDSQDIPKLAEYTSVNSPKEYYYFKYTSDIQNAPKAPIVTTRQKLLFVSLC